MLHHVCALLCGQLHRVTLTLVIFNLGTAAVHLLGVQQTECSAVLYKSSSKITEFLFVQYFVKNEQAVCIASSYTVKLSH
jgi:hypothetical protein